MAAKQEIYNEIMRHVREIEDTRRLAKKFPTHAMIIRDRLVGKTTSAKTPIEFFTALGEMVEHGLITTGRTVNDTYVRINRK